MYFLPYRMATTADSIFGRVAGDYGNLFGLTISEWRIVAILGDSGQLTQRDLVRATTMDKVAVNRACKNLINRGFLRRSPHLQDGRSHHLDLSKDGHSLFEQIWAHAEATHQQVFSALTPREAEHLDNLLEKLMQ
jgi:DNA-binding MarR family transcriptional regulator